MNNPWFKWPLLILAATSVLWIVYSIADTNDRFKIVTIESAGVFLLDTRTGNSWRYVRETNDKTDELITIFWSQMARFHDADSENAYRDLIIEQQKN